MAQPDALDGRSFGSQCVNPVEGSVAGLVNTSLEPTLPRGAVAELVLGAPEGAVLALGGIDGESLRVLLDQVEPERCGRRALLARNASGPTAEAIVEQVIDLLAETARR